MPTPDTLEAYHEIRQKPYAFEYFGIQDNGLPTYIQWASIVDDYVKQEIVRHDYKDSLQTYREVISSVGNSLGLGDNVIGSVRLRKVAQWIRDVLLPTQRIELRKQRILHGHRSI